MGIHLFEVVQYLFDLLDRRNTNLMPLMIRDHQPSDVF